ncbi:MAG: histidine phosphatase family protein [Myxococcota bacterium]
MQIYLVRHAIAEERGGAFVDAERPLTLDGIERFERAVRGLAKLRIEFDIAFHSPWRRAVETAQRLAPLLGSGGRVETDELARPPSRALLRMLEGERPAVVGHQPWLGELAAWLCTGDRSLGSGFALKKGGVCFLEGEPVPGGAVLRALWTPRTLRRLA